MKIANHICSVFFAGLLLILAYNCKPGSTTPEPILSQATVTTTAATGVSTTSATLGGNVTGDGGATVTERGVVYATTQTPTTANTKVAVGTGTGSFTTNVTGLTAGTTYYVRAYAINSKGTAYGSQETFTCSLALSLPTVTTTPASAVTSTGATLGGNVTADGNATVSERGVVYATTQTPTTSNTKVAIGTGTGSFTTNVTGLTAGTTYYVRAYAINSQGTAYGSQETFTCSLALSIPTVSTTPAASITSSGATLGGNVTNDGNAAVSEKGVVYATTANPTTSNTKVVVGTGGTGSYSTTVTGLTAGTTYYVRAYAINSQGTAYGIQETFTCGSVTLSQATVTTTAATSVTTTGATLGGNVTSDGNATVTERGVVYATTQTPTTSNTKVAIGTGTGSFTTNVTGLTSGTTYYVRAYAINSQGTAYGSQETFTCSSVTLSQATVTTTAATSVTTTGATLGGNVTSDGNATVTERGVVYATTQTPTTSNTKVAIGTGTGSFTTNVIGLTSGSTYYVRAYAINSQGTAYGSQETLTTAANQLLTAADYYLNLRVGNYLKFHTTYVAPGVNWGPRTTYYKIIGTETINGQIYYIEEDSEKLDDNNDPIDVFAKFWLKKDADGNIVFGAYDDNGTKIVLDIDSQGRKLHNQYLVLGYSHSSDWTAGINYTVDVISTTATAGIYTNCLQIRETSKTNGIVTLIEDSYYAYHVGLVKTSRSFPASQINTAEIVEFVNIP